MLSDIISIINRFVALGGNFIDTADSYCGEHTQEILGKWLATQDRESLVISTKIGLPLHSMPGVFDKWLMFLWNDSSSSYCYERQNGFRLLFVCGFHVFDNNP